MDDYDFFDSGFFSDNESPLDILSDYSENIFNEDLVTEDDIVINERPKQKRIIHDNELKEIPFKIVPFKTVHENLLLPGLKEVRKKTIKYNNSDSKEFSSIIRKFKEKRGDLMASIGGYIPRYFNRDGLTKSQEHKLDMRERRRKSKFITLGMIIYMDLQYHAMEKMHKSLIDEIYKNMQIERD